MPILSKRSHIIIVFTVVMIGAVYIASKIYSKTYFETEGIQLAQKIDGFTSKVLYNNAIPGAAVAVVKNGQVVYSQCFGVADVSDETRRIDPTSNFHLASISKALVAIAVFKLVEEGKLELDKPVVKYYPEFSMTDARSSKITIRQILTHTSGIPDVEDYEWDNPSYDSLALARYVQTLSTKTLLFAPGEKWDYSNAAYDLLGAMISAITNQSFEQYMKENILNPLKMTTSTFYFPETDSATRIKGHTGKFKAQPVAYYPYNRAHAPSSTLQSNLTDAINFVVRLTINSTILERESLTAMWKPHTTVDEGIDMGLGWFVTRHGLAKLVITAGRDPGFSSMIAILPEQKIAVITLTNSSLETHAQLDFVKGILDIGLGKDPNPIASISLPVAKVYGEHGVDAAIAEYYRIRKNEPSAYSTGIGELTWAIHEVIDEEAYDDALKLLNVEAHEYPKCHICYTYAMVYLKKDIRDSVAYYYKKWLEYLPDERDERIENYLNEN